MNDKDSMVLFLLRFGVVAAIAIAAYVGYIALNQFDPSGTQVFIAVALLAGLFVVKKVSG